MRLLMVLLSMLALAAPSLAAPPLAMGGDPARGAIVYERCQACHSLARNRTGPKHCGLLGRAAGSVAGFAYSPAMRGSGIVWDEAALDSFLADPRGVVPRTTMGYDGVKDAQQRADLIAYLATAVAGSTLCR
jgi:cytochrome c